MRRGRRKTRVERKGKKTQEERTLKYEGIETIKT